MTIGELWAVAITLRITLVENLRRLAEAIVRIALHDGPPTPLPDRLLGIGGKTNPPSLVRGSFDRARHSRAGVCSAVGSSACATGRLGRLPAIHWLRRTPRRSGHDEGTDRSRRAACARRHERHRAQRHHQHAADLEHQTGARFFESVSLVDAALGQDSSEFAGDGFRHAQSCTAVPVEEARARFGTQRVEVTQRALAVRQACSSPHVAGAKLSDRDRDPGYYLIGLGRPAFERGLSYRAPPEWLARLSTRCKSGSLSPGDRCSDDLIATLPIYLLSRLGIAGWTLVCLGLLRL